MLKIHFTQIIDHYIMCKALFLVSILLDLIKWLFILLLLWRYELPFIYILKKVLIFSSLIFIFKACFL